jgi:hypothetical protein
MGYKRDRWRKWGGFSEHSSWYLVYDGVKGFEENVK